MIFVYSPVDGKTASMPVKSFSDKRLQPVYLSFDIFLISSAVNLSPYNLLSLFLRSFLSSQKIVTDLIISYLSLYERSIF